MVSIFVATFDPNEVAAFFLIGTIWDFFFSITSGITGAAQIRVAQNLGECNPEKAKESAFRSIYIVGFLTGTGALVGLCIRQFISSSFASDEATISVINDTLPIVLFGTFADGFGNVACGIVEGQGRFQLTSSVAVAQTLFMAVPLSAIMTYALDFGVQGIASALVVAYLTSGTFVLTQVLSSNWESYVSEFQREDDILTECELEKEMVSIPIPLRKSAGAKKCKDEKEMSSEAISLGGEIFQP
jgi:MATE family multidrug resistance protein